MEGLMKQALGYSPDQLVNFGTVLRLPPALQQAYSNGDVPLRALLDLAGRPREEVESVAAEIRARVAPAEAVFRHRTIAEPVPAARTCLRRLLLAVAGADARLAGRVAVLGYLEAPDRDVLERGRHLLDELLALPSKGDLLTAMLGDRPASPGRLGECQDVPGRPRA
jgi:hypothetical protein